MIDKNIDLLESSFSDFAVPLRMGVGFNDELFNKFCNIVKVCKEQWAHQECIPKRAVQLLVDIYPAMLSSSHFYNESINEEINKGIDDVTDLIRDLLSS